MTRSDGSCCFRRAAPGSCQLTPELHRAQGTRQRAPSWSALTGLLMVGAGGLVNLIYLVSGSDYANFADAAHFSFIRETWR